MCACGICGKSRLGSPLIRGSKTWGTYFWESPLSRDRKGCGTYFGPRLMQYEKVKNKDKGQRFLFSLSLIFLWINTLTK